MTIIQTHPAIQKIQNTIANRPKSSPVPSLPTDDDPPPKLLDPPLLKKAAKLLNMPLAKKLKDFSHKVAIKPIKPIPEPRSPTKPTRIPKKFDYNHTSKSWKP